MSDCRFGVSPVNYPDPELFSVPSFDKSESVISCMDKSVKHAVGPYFCIILIKFLNR